MNFGVLFKFFLVVDVLDCARLVDVRFPTRFFVEAMVHNQARLPQVMMWRCDFDLLFWAP